LVYGNVIKKCLVVAGDSLNNEFKNKIEICNAIKEFQLSRSAVTIGVERLCVDIKQQLRQAYCLLGYNVRELPIQKKLRRRICDLQK
jgi:hypothetical protein